MASSLKCFVPNMLVDMINTDLIVGKDYIEPLSIFMNAVCLVVDISGFTRLSGEFCKMGKDGIDQLQLATNGYMGQLVDIIYGFGGEIIKFAGDAIICVFASRTAMRSSASFSKIARSNSNVSDSSEPSWLASKGSTKSIELPPLSPELIVSALQCAQELRFVQTEKLTAHVAISSGEICFGILGGYENKWECLISGPCIQELSSCLDDAPSKQAAISAGCAKILQAASICTEITSGELHGKTILPEGVCEYELALLPSGNCRIDSVACAAAGRLQDRPIGVISSMVTSSAASQKQQVQDRALDLVRMFVPESVADKLDAEAELRNLAEMREVTTMFMKWDSYDATTMHRDLLMLQPHFYEVQKVLQSTGAYLRQFLVDDKGCVLIACWGMPNLSYLDNAHRAISTAAQIRRKMLAMDMECSFGITTGDVYCGTVGSALRMEYAAIGSVVNMAARLMCKAHGGIYIDDATHERLPSEAASSLAALEPIKVKGREEPLPVFEYVNATTLKVEEKVVDDSAIPPFKREIMINFLGTMLEKDDEMSAPAAISEDEVEEGAATASRKLAWWAWASDTSGSRIHDAAGRYRARNVSSIPLQILLIKGRDGSGKTCVVKWLRKKAQDREIPVSCLKLTPKDAQTPYLVWRRMFQMLMPKDLFVSPDAQRTHVHKLLSDIYPDVSRSVRKLKFAVFKSVLGISCSYSRLKPSRSAHSMWLPRENSLFHKDHEAALTTGTILEVLYDVFAHLLNATPTLLVIENIENGDDGSLRVLCSLLKLKTRSAIVLTALKEIALEKTTQTQLSPFRTRAVRQDALHSTLWTKKYKCVVQCHRSTHVIFLEPFRAAEIEKLLATSLKLPTVPDELVKLVQDYSGGSCFWVLELLQFITEHGVDYFMSTIANQDDASPEKIADPTAVRRRSSNNAAKVTQRMNSTRASMMPLTPEERRHQKQLDKLVLCRFGNLSPDVQRVLRTASIIGMSFSQPLLTAVLPPALQATLSESIQALVTLKWLYQDIDNDQLFQFAHVHSRQLIYDLTPSSERSATHQQIAEYMEAAFPSDQTTYPLLTYHYQQCDPVKSLAYTTKALEGMLRVESVFDFVDCLDLLSGAVGCCQSVQDAVALHGLINQAQIAIVMFSMNQQLSEQKKPHHHRARFALHAWLMICGGGSSAVVPTDYDEDHHHDHHHEHDHGHGDDHHHDQHGDECDPHTHKCPCKQEEAEDAEDERSFLARAGGDLAVAAEERKSDEAARTKKAFLRHLQEISDQLQDAKELMENDARTAPLYVTALSTPLPTPQNLSASTV